MSEVAKVGAARKGIEIEAGQLAQQRKLFGHILMCRRRFIPQVSAGSWYN